MSTKAKKESSKKSSNSSSSAGHGKIDRKTIKAGDKEKTKEAEAKEPDSPQQDPEEIEEQEDAKAAESSNQNAAALAAAAGGSSEMSASFKNFRHHPDMENFYRFIFENDLRHEALAIIDEIMIEKQQRKLGKNSKVQAH